LGLDLFLLVLFISCTSLNHLNTFHLGSIHGIDVKSTGTLFFQLSGNILDSGYTVSDWTTSSNLLLGALYSLQLASLEITSHSIGQISFSTSSIKSSTIFLDSVFVFAQFNFLLRDSNFLM